VRKVLVPILCVAVAAAACSSPGAEEVATVDGTVVDIDDVSALFLSDTIPIDDAFRWAASLLVAERLMEGAYRSEFGGAVDEDEADRLYEQSVAQMDTQGATAADVMRVPDASFELIRLRDRINVIGDQVMDELLADPDTIAGLLADPAELTTVCSSHILVETEEEATAVIERLDAGEEFSAVATEVSLDTGSPGGDLGCSAPGAYVDAFATAVMEAEVGALHGPVETEFGFHVILVNERTTPSEEEVTADPRGYASNAFLSSLWSAWFTAVIEDAEIEVNSKYGVWDPTMRGIVASPTE
jgi:parvulin-like peptidyl-prolyl isomerase